MPMQGIRELVFQPTLPHRERHIGSSFRIMSKIFQPTLPHRERLFSTRQRLQKIIYFNPRSRTGSDMTRRTPYPATKAISTHAPAQGATRFPGLFPPFRERFQPTLPHRERQQKDTKYTLSFCTKQKRICRFTFLKLYLLEKSSKFLRHKQR